MDRGNISRSELRIREWIHYHRVQRTEEKNHQLLQARSQDFERQNARLEAISSYWQGVVEGIIDEVWVCDLQGRMSLINLPEVTQMGLAEFNNLYVEQVLERVDILNPDGQPRPMEDAPLLRSLKGESVRGEEIMRDRRSGRQRYRQFSSAPTRDDHGGITGAVAVVRDITEQKQIEEALRENQHELAVELGAAHRLQELSGQLITGGGLQELYESMLETAIAIMGADGGSIQMLAEGGILHLLAWRGFHPQSAHYWDQVTLENSCACEEAMCRRERLIVPDIEQSELKKGTPDQDEFRRSGIRAVQSTPLISRSGRLLGVISTHWQQPHQPRASELRTFDILVRQISDLIERKYAEKALRESEAKYRELFESLIEGYCVIEMIFDEHSTPVDFRYLETNPAFERQATQPMLGKRIKEIVPDVEQFWLDQYGHVARTGEPVQFEHIVDGLGKQWFQIAAYRVGDEHSHRVAVVFENITERKLAEERLTYQADLIENVHDAILAMDGDLHITYWNQAAEQLYGWSKAEALGQDASQLLRSELAGRQLEEALNQGAQTGSFHGEIIHYARDGRRLVIDAQSRFRKDASGRVVSILTANRDVTGRKQMEQALAKANQFLEQRVNERTAELISAAQELEKALQTEKLMRQQLIQSEKYAALSRLVASVAHEINNPLQTIQNSMYLLRNAVQDGKNREFMEMAISESSRMSYLVSQLRETYRPAKDLQAVEFNLNDLIDKVQALMQPQFRQNHVDFQIQREEKPCMVHGVPDQLQQVFLNIFLNAVDAMGSSGGQLTVDLTQPEDQGKVCVAIQDTGPGIAPDHLNKIFEPFFTTKEKGTGLGLAISYEIIKDHGGEITVESEVGKGATFKVCLPVTQPT